MELGINKKDYRSPNFSSRHNTPIDTIIIHHTGHRFPIDIQWLCNKKSKVSAHYYIKRTGEIYELVDPKYKAWHAGKSSFDYDDDGIITDLEKYLNARSIGIELETGYPYKSEEEMIEDRYIYPATQVLSLMNLVLGLVFKYNIPTSNILGHKEVSLGRKWDPGRFDMPKFRNFINNIIKSEEDGPIAAH